VNAIVVAVAGYCSVVAAAAGMIQELLSRNANCGVVKTQFPKGMGRCLRSGGHIAQALAGDLLMLR